MKNKKYILAFTLSVATFITATIPHEEIMGITPTEDEVQQTLTAIIVNESARKSDLQTIVDNEEAPKSDLQVAVEATTSSNPTVLENVTSVIEVTAEQAQAMNIDAANLVDGFSFEYDNKKYIIKNIICTKNIATIIEASQK